MLKLIVWEFGKLVRFKTAHVALLIVVILPILWAFAPGLPASLGIEVVSGWQVPTLSLRTGISYIFPFLVAMVTAEILGSEVAMGTLKSLLLRPSSRSNLLLAKLAVALAFPAVLLFASLISSLLIGLVSHGLGDFFGGTGLTASEFTGDGQMSAGTAFGEQLRAHILSIIALWPMASMTLMFSVIFLSTTSAALGAIAGERVATLLSQAYPFLKTFIFTNFMNIFGYPASELMLPLGSLLIHTIGFSVLAVMLFEKKDI